MTECFLSIGKMFSLFFSAKVTGAEDGTQVASLDDTQVQQMRDIMWEMNACLPAPVPRGMKWKLPK